MIVCARFYKSDLSLSGVADAHKLIKPWGVALRRANIIAVIVALGSGIAIGAQSAITGRAGQIVGPVRTGILMNFAGGVLAGLILLALLAVQGVSAWQLTRTDVVLFIIAGALGLVIIGSLAYGLPRAGVAAGLATVILGQMLIAVIVDVVGLGGMDPIPIDARRIIGLVVMAVAVYLLLPRG